MSVLMLGIVAQVSTPESVAVELSDRGLQTAAAVLQARFGTTINFEGVPLTIEGLHYQPFVWADGSVHYVAKPLGVFRFAYAPDATVTEAAQAAVTAYNEAPTAYARYKVVEHDGVLDLVPTDVLTATGWMSYVSPLDTVITLAQTTGTPTDLWHATLTALAQAKPPAMMTNDTRQTMDPSSDLSVTLDLATAPARNTLAKILHEADYANRWELTYLPKNVTYEGWRLDYLQLQPEHESRGNLTPLVPPQ